MTRDPAIASVGVDAELDEPVPADVREVVMLAEERREAERLSATAPAIAWDRLLFSAKESVFKTWFPLTGQWLDFSECRIALSPRPRTFTATLLVPGPVVDGTRVQVFEGRWAREAVAADGLGRLATAVTVGRPRATR